MDRSRSCLTRLMFVATALSGSVVFATEVPCSAELAMNLGKWRTALSKLNRFEVRGQRMVYSDIFEVEQRSKFIIQCETPHSLRIEFQSITIPPGEMSRRVNRTAHRAFSVETAKPTLWLWSKDGFKMLHPGTGKVILPSDEAVESFLSANLPAPRSAESQAVDDLGAYGPLQLWQEWSRRFTRRLFFSFWHLVLPKHALPSVFAADEPGFVERFDWSISRMKSGAIRLDGKPELERDRGDFQSLSVILDVSTGRPLAQKTVSPSGDFETV